jgi:hypothetical protein
MSSLRRASFCQSRLASNILRTIPIPAAGMLRRFHCDNGVGGRPPQREVAGESIASCSPAGLFDPLWDPSYCPTFRGLVSSSGERPDEICHSESGTSIGHAANNSHANAAGALQRQLRRWLLWQRRDDHQRPHQ